MKTYLPLVYYTHVLHTTETCDPMAYSRHSLEHEPQPSLNFTRSHRRDLAGRTNEIMERRDILQRSLYGLQRNNNPLGKNAPPTVISDMCLHPHLLKLER